MRVTINGNQLKEAITVCKLKGKYNEGMGNANSLLCDDVILQVKDDRLYVQNADNYTYIVYRLDCEESENGSIVVSGTTLSKYLTDTNVVMTNTDGILSLKFDDTEVTIPLLVRHTNSGVITRLSEYLMDLNRTSVSKTIREKGSIQVTPKLHLDTILKVSSDEFSLAMSLAEKVGNSIYNLNWNKEELIVSSNNGNEKVQTEIIPIDYTGEDATVDISLPIANLSKIENSIVLAYGDDVPVVFINNKVTILRGPRDR
tara:strand:+ start:1388 stop:2161 length:774 start_codon:yes stop_codon:yes gene_type:complete